MLDITTTRHNPLVDPVLSVWSWEIPVYLFFGGMIAGMMILAGINMLKLLKGERPESFYSVQTPILGFVLMNLGMGALFLDLAHKLYVYRVYMAFEPTVADVVGLLGAAPRLPGDPRLRPHPPAAGLAVAGRAPARPAAPVGRDRLDAPAA